LSRGATIECSRPSLAAIGAGSASRSILPLALSGSAGRKTNADGQHVVRELRLQHRAQRRRRERLRAGPGDEVRDELGLVRPVFAQHDERVRERRHVAQHDLDLGRLDPMAAKLHLLVQPAQENEVAVRLIPDQVAGAIHRHPAELAAIDCDEALIGELRALPVSARDALAADVQLAGDAYGYRLPISIEHRHLEIRDRPADGERRLVARDRFDAMPRGERHRLGRTVHVDEPTRGACLEACAHPARVDRLAAEQHVLDAGKSCGLRANDRVEEGRGHEQRSDSVVAKAGAEFFRIQRDLAPQEHEARAVEKRAPDLERRRIERRIGNLRDAVAGIELDVVGAADEAGDATMRHHHPFGLAGRSRRVDDVGKRIRGCGRRRIGIVPSRDLRRVAIDARDATAVRRQVREMGAFRDQDPDGRVLQHERETLRWIVGIERHIGSARLEDSDHRDDHVGRAFEKDPDRIAGREAQGAQVVSEAVGANVEIAIGHDRVFLDQGRRVRVH
jgi:hypothetical protein